MSHVAMSGNLVSLEHEYQAMGPLLDPVRFPYFHRVLTVELLHDPADLSVLDVGCGAGSLSLLFARAGYHVTGIDANASAIDLARIRASQEGVAAQFDTGFAESLPYGASTFDVVVCSEVLEHVANLERTLDELYRVLRFGGVLLFSTPNRTIWSRLLLIKLAQDWKITRVMSTVEHEYDKLIRPNEFVARLADRGIDTYAIDGMQVPLGEIPRALRMYIRFKRGEVPLRALAGAMGLSVGRSKALAYLGWGVKFG